MSVAVEDPPLVLGTGHGGMPARRAVVRWAWRLFRREWRQQSIVLALLLVAVAATTVGLGIGANTMAEASVFGTANHLVTPGQHRRAARRRPRQAAQLVRHRRRDRARRRSRCPARRTASTCVPRTPPGRTAGRCCGSNQGRWPQGPDEIAVTDRVATIFRLRCRRHLGPGRQAADRGRSRGEPAQPARRVRPRGARPGHRAGPRRRAHPDVHSGLHLEAAARRHVDPDPPRHRQTRPTCWCSCSPRSG